MSSLRRLGSKETRTPFACRALHTLNTFAAMGALDKADPTGHDLVVNATPAGMKESDPSPVDIAKLDGKMFVADIITMPLLTPLLAAAQASGCRTQNGQDMFNAQGDFITQFLLGS